MKILITAFEPFGGEKINPSMELIKDINADNISTLVIPTSFKNAPQAIIDQIEKFKKETNLDYDYVISIGQAGGRSHISLERIGVNMMNASIKDNDGFKPTDQLISQDGPDGIFSTLDVSNLVDKLKEANIPAQVSNSAGLYVCNCVLYSTLKYIKDKKLSTKVGFVHIPYLPIQTVEKVNIASMSLETMQEALKIIINNS